MNKHNGINATRDVLKDQLVLAADDKIERAAIVARSERFARIVAVLALALGAFIARVAL